MGNTSSTESPVVHITTIAKWMKSRKLVIDKETHEVSGLHEDDEAQLKDALQQAIIITKNRGAAIFVNAILENDKKYILKEVDVHYLNSLHLCLNYVDIEIQIASAGFIAELCDPLNSEPLGTIYNTTYNADLKEGTVQQVQDLRMRLGSFGFVFPAVLLVFQAREDLQLLGLKIVAGLALHPLNRILVAEKMGLQPLIIHILSVNPSIRIMSSVTISRLVAQPEMYDLINHDEEIHIPEAASRFPKADFFDMLPRELIPVISAMFGEYLEGSNDPLPETEDDALGGTGHESRVSMKDRLVNDNAAYVIKQGCVVSMLTVILRSIVEASEVEEAEDSNLVLPVGDGEDGVDEGGTEMPQSAVMASAALYGLVELARQSKTARQLIATTRVVLKLNHHSGRRSKLDVDAPRDITATGSDIILFMTTNDAQLELRRGATELIVELVREEENTTIFRSEITLSDGLFRSMKRSLKKRAERTGHGFSENGAKESESTLTFRKGTTATGKFNSIFLLYSASFDPDEIVRANAMVAFLELSIDNMNMYEIIKYNATEPILNAAKISTGNSTLKRRCAWALSAVGMQFAGMTRVELNAFAEFHEAILTLVLLLSAGEDVVVQREAARALSAFALLEVGAEFIAVETSAVEVLVALLEEALSSSSMLLDTLLMTVRAAGNLLMYPRHHAALLKAAKRYGHSCLEELFGRMIEEHWDVSRDVSYFIVMQEETKKLVYGVEEGEQSPGSGSKEAQSAGGAISEISASKLAEDSRKWHAKYRAKAAMIPEEIQRECILAIGCVMRPDYLSSFKHRWVDLYASWLQSPDIHVQSKSTASISNISRHGLAQLRLVEHPEDYCEISLFESVRVERGLSVSTWRGLDILPILAEMVRSQTVTLAPKREAARALSNMSRSPNGMVSWLRLSPDDSNLMYVDFSANSLVVVKGSPRRGGSNNFEDGANGDMINDPESENGSSIVNQHQMDVEQNEAWDYGIVFRQGDALLLKEIDSSVDCLRLREEAGDPDASVALPKCPVFPKPKIGNKPEWTMSVWVYICKKESQFSTGSLMTLMGPNSVQVGSYATICESSIGDQYLAVKVVAKSDDSKQEGRPVDGLSPKQRAVLEGDDEPEYVCHRLAAYDAKSKQWLECGFDMQVVPHGWRHLVAIGTNDRIFFYVDTYCVGSVDKFYGKGDIACVGNSVSLTHPAGLISDFRAYGHLIPKAILKGNAAVKHPFNAIRPNADHGLYPTLKERLNEKTTSRTSSQRGRRQSFLKRTKIPEHHSSHVDYSMEDLWYDLPPDYVSYYMGNQTIGLIPALVGALATDSAEITMTAARTIANLALIVDNRPKILAAGALIPLVRLTNHKNPIVAFESSRAMLHLR